MSHRGEFLVAIINNRLDFAIAYDIFARRIAGNFSLASPAMKRAIVITTNSFSNRYRNYQSLFSVAAAGESFSSLRRALDNLRDNDLESAGWQQLRFTAHQIREQMAEYCVPKIVETINNLDGLEEEGRLTPRKIDLNAPDGSYQMGLFDNLSGRHPGRAG